MANSTINIQENIFIAGQREAKQIPVDISRKDFIKLVTTSPPSQQASLAKQSRTHPNLQGITVSQSLSNTRDMEASIDKVFEEL